MKKYVIMAKARREEKDMKTIKIHNVAMNAMIACVYAILTIICSSFSYGSIQLRLSEILIFLAYYNRKFIPGLVVGCLFANVFSPMGIYDMLFGTFATLLTCFALNRVHHLWMGALTGALFNGVIVGLQLYYLLDLPFFINAGYVFLGEGIVLMIGVILFKMIEKNEVFMKKYILPQ